MKPSKKEKKHEPGLVPYALILVLVSVVLITSLIILGPYYRECLFKCK